MARFKTKSGQLPSPCPSRALASDSQNRLLEEVLQQVVFPLGLSLSRSGFLIGREGITAASYLTVIPAGRRAPPPPCPAAQKGRSPPSCASTLLHRGRHTTRSVSPQTTQTKQAPQNQYPRNTHSHPPGSHPTHPGSQPTHPATHPTVTHPASPAASPLDLPRDGVAVLRPHAAQRDGHAARADGGDAVHGQVRAVALEHQARPWEGRRGREGEGVGGKGRQRAAGGLSSAQHPLSMYVWTKRRPPLSASGGAPQQPRLPRPPRKKPAPRPAHRWAAGWPARRSPCPL